MTQPLLTPTERAQKVSQIFRDYGPLLLNTIRKYLFQSQDAEDVLTECFLALLKHPTIIEQQEASIYNWLRRVAYNKAMDVHRSQSKRSLFPLDEVDETSDWLTDPASTPEQETLKQERYAQLAVYIAELPENQQRVLRSSFVLNMKGVDIARQLKMNESTVRSLLSRAIRGLRTIYARKGMYER